MSNNSQLKQLEINRIGKICLGKTYELKKNFGIFETATPEAFQRFQWS